MKFEEIVKRGLEEVLARSSPTTHRPYIGHARAFVERWGELRAGELGKRDIQAWAKERRNQVCVGTVRHELALLRMCLNWACDEGLINANPACQIRLPRGHKRHQWLTKDEEPVLRHYYCQQDLGELEWQVARFAILTGCRRGEQLHLQPHHIQGQTLVIPTEGKTGERLIGLHPEAKQIAEIWGHISRESGSPYLFWPEATGCRFTFGENYASRTFKPRAVEAGLGHLQWRDLRRTFACRLILLKTPIFEIQKMLGHASPEQTMTYCQIHVSQLYQSVTRLN